MRKFDKIEQLKADKSMKQGKFFRRERINLVRRNYPDSDSGSEELKINLAEIKDGPPYTCLALTRAVPKGKMDNANRKTFAFDLAKANQIFDIFLKGKQIKLPTDHILK